MSVRYYKLNALLKKNNATLEGMRIALKLLPSTISKIRTNRMIDHMSILLICNYLNCGVEDILEMVPDDGMMLYDAKILEKHSYTPLPQVTKEFKSPLVSYRYNQ